MRVHDMIPTLAYEEENRVFILKNGYLGCVFEADPMQGADDTRAAMLRSALQFGMAPGAFLQVSLIALPTIANQLTDYENDRLSGLHSIEKSETREFLMEAYKKRMDFLNDAVDEPVLPGSGQLLHDRRLLISLKSPYKQQTPSKKEFDEFISAMSKLKDSLRSAGIYCRAITDDEYSLYVSAIFSPESRPFVSTKADNMTMDETIARPGTTMEVKFDHIRLNGESKIKVLGVKALPPSSSLSLGYLMQGDYLGQNNQMQCPYMITLSLHHPKQGPKIAKMKQKSLIANYQAFGPLLKFIPKLASKKTSMDVIINAIEDGESLFEVCLQVVLFSKDEEKVDSTASSMITYYTSLGLQMAEERRVVLPALFNALPMNPTKDSIENLFRYSTLAASHAAALLPVVAEWKGNVGKGSAMMHLSRRGQVATFDLYNSSTNYNSVIFAESGSGKSFLTQDIIVNYLSKGAKVWVIDVGRSYYKLAKVLGGEFIEFSDTSGICVNPFTHVTNIDDDAPMLQALIEKMAAPLEGLDDYRYSRLEEGIKAVWGNLGDRSSISAVAEYFNRHPDPRIQDIGSQLFSYTHQGSMGFWFDGANNVDLSNDLVVLELEELKSRKQLQQVILMQVISSIQREMYLSKDGRPKILIIDEAWDLLDDKMVGKFIEHAYRRFRKYGGAAVVVTQSIADLYGTPSGQAIAANSAFKFILKQSTESILRVRENKYLMGPDAMFGQMQTVHTLPGKYSEFMMLTDGGFGVYRLVVDRFSQLLYSTAPHERIPIINAIEAGGNPLQVIEEFMNSRG